MRWGEGVGGLEMCGWVGGCVCWDESERRGLGAYSLVGGFAGGYGALGASVARVGSIQDGDIIGVGSIASFDGSRGGEQRKEESCDFGVHGCKSLYK